jgi:ubiquinol-cytochrome c reductase core subunit 2
MGLLSKWRTIGLISVLAFEYNEEVEHTIHLRQERFLADASAVAQNSIHAVAFHHGLGNSIYPTSSLPLTKYLNGQSIKSFSQDAYTKSNIAVVANGAAQSDLAKWVNEFFGDLSTGSALSSEATKYFGGEERISYDNGNSYIIAFPGSSSFTAGPSYKPEATVLAALLGGKSTIKWSPGFSLLSKAASSFPGASASTTHFAYSDAGLLTVEFTGSAEAIRGAVVKGIEALKSVAAGSISKEDFTKAIALAKFDSLEAGSNTDAGLISTGTGLVQGDKPYQLDEVTKSIEGVTQEKLKAVSLIKLNSIILYFADMLCRLLRHFWRVRQVFRLLEIFSSFLTRPRLVLTFRFAVLD